MSDKGTWYEEFKVSSDQVVGKLRKLLHEGDVRRVFLKDEGGRTLVEFPLTAGVAVTAVVALAAPALVAAGAVAALLTRVTIGVEREGDGVQREESRASGEEGDSGDEEEDSSAPTGGH